ncbi:MAG: hypothetical protein V4604_10150 [Bacteroidota bacterium]
MTLTEQPYSLTFKPNLILGPTKQLIVSKESIQLNRIGKSNEQAIHFDKNDIVSYRFGIKWITGYMFTIGREYQLFIKDNTDRTIKINLKSFYGFKKKELTQRYSKIIESVWKNYFAKIANDYLKQLSDGEMITICGVRITDKEVTIETNNPLNKKSISIPWEHVGTKDYHTYYAIFSTENPTDINRGYYYKDEWNVGVLYSVMETLKNHLTEPD